MGMEDRLAQLRTMKAEKETKDREAEKINIEQERSSLEDQLDETFEQFSEAELKLSEVKKGFQEAEALAADLGDQGSEILAEIQTELQAAEQKFKELGTQMDALNAQIAKLESSQTDTTSTETIAVEGSVESEPLGLEMTDEEREAAMKKLEGIQGYNTDWNLVTGFQKYKDEVLTLQEGILGDNTGAVERLILNLDTISQSKKDRQEGADGPGLKPGTMDRDTRQVIAETNVEILNKRLIDRLKENPDLGDLEDEVEKKMKSIQEFIKDDEDLLESEKNRLPDKTWYHQEIEERIIKRKDEYSRLQRGVEYINAQRKELG